MIRKIVVVGDPVGYYVQGGRPNWKRMRAYVEWKEHVQKSAMMCGVKLPLTASREWPLWIHTSSWFRNGVHADPENIRKGISDALFYAGKGEKGSADKYTGGSFGAPLYDPDNPRVEVHILDARDREGILEVIRASWPS